MYGIEGSNQSEQSAACRCRPFQDALQPGDLTHHALVRDVPPQALPWIIRESQRRLYDVRSSGTAHTQRIVMRQGFPFWWGAILCALGWVLLAGFLVAGSDLGRSFQLLDGSGSAAHAAAPGLLHPWMQHSSPLLLWIGLAFEAVAFFLAWCPRKHLFLVAQKNDSDLFDLWISGTSWRQERQFDREFQDLARGMDRLRCRAIADEPQASHQGP